MMLMRVGRQTTELRVGVALGCALVAGVCAERPGHAAGDTQAYAKALVGQAPVNKHNAGVDRLPVRGLISPHLHRISKKSSELRYEKFEAERRLRGVKGKPKLTAEKREELTSDVERVQTDLAKLGGVWPLVENVTRGWKNDPKLEQAPGSDRLILRWLLQRSKNALAQMASEVTDAAKSEVDTANADLSSHLTHLEADQVADKVSPQQHAFDRASVKADWQSVQETVAGRHLSTPAFERLRQQAESRGIALTEVIERFCQVHDAVMEAHFSETRPMDKHGKPSDAINSAHIVALTEIGLEHGVTPETLGADFAHFRWWGVPSNRERRALSDQAATLLVQLTHEGRKAAVSAAMPWDGEFVVREAVGARFVRIVMLHAADQRYRHVPLSDTDLARVTRLSFKHADRFQFRDMLREYVATRSEARESLLLDRNDGHTIAKLVDYGIAHGRDATQRATDFKTQVEQLEGTVDRNKMLHDADVVRLLARSNEFSLNPADNAELVAGIRRVNPDWSSDRVLTVWSASAEAKLSSNGQPRDLKQTHLAQAAKLIRRSDTSLTHWLHSVLKDSDDE